MTRESFRLFYIKFRIERLMVSYLRVFYWHSIGIMSRVSYMEDR